MALGCSAVACESVGTIGRATGVEDDDVAASSSTTSVEADDGASSSSSSSSDGPETSGNREPASGGDESEAGDAATSTGDGPGTLMATGSESGLESGEGDEPCCAPESGPGCGDEATESCVCALDPYCCEQAWDESCVNTALLSGCSVCPTVRDPEQMDCCTPNVTAGCTDVALQDCVCALDPYCCEQAWDQVCVDKVADLDCGSCG
ncbi:MAG TPA: hypothetical protein VFG69_05910 [Nannocystaceae bacterium]|nr:hypothetical protein [Nannocystaceae bacterium]